MESIFKKIESFFTPLVAASGTCNVAQFLSADVYLQYRQIYWLDLA